MAEKNQLRSILEFHPLFGVLTSSTLSKVVDNFKEIYFGKNQYIFMQGDEADYAYLILNGTALMETLSIEGSTLSLGRLSQGDFFGEFSLIDQKERSTGVFALSQLHVAYLDKLTLNSLLAQNPEFSMQMIKHLIKLLRLTDRQLETVHFLNLPQKLAFCLVQETVKFQAVERRLPYTQAALARQLSVSREKVNAAIKLFRARGLIESGRGYIKVLNLNGLRRVYSDKISGIDDIE